MNSDSQLQSSVLEELKWRPSVNAAHIGVTAKHGVVTLTGQVAHYTEKSEAEEAAKGVYGVKGIANDIEIEITGSFKRSDQDIAEAVLNALKWDFQVPNDKIKVVVKNGWVTLEVQDTGLGMSADEQKIIFERFRTGKSPCGETLRRH